MPFNNDDFDLIDTFAHDLKTPLGAIKTSVEMMEAYGPLNEKQAHYRERALHNVGRITRMLEDMIAFARAESDPVLEMKDVDMASLIYDAIDTVQDEIEAKNLQVMVDITPELGMVVANKQMLNHAITNLVSNGVKYNSDGGALVVRVVDEVTSVRVEVQDTGLGINPSDQQRIFDRFFRAKKDKRVRSIDGTGLGLAIVRAVVRRHGGHIWVDSQLNKGSTFSFTLPRNQLSGQSPQPEPHRVPDLVSVPAHDTASELIDDLDDNLQESHEAGETDSRADEV